jgi:hypothetical protein
LELTNDTGNSATDGATADGAISGHVANAGGQAVTLEIDKDGNGTVDATVSSNAETGEFSYSPTGLANGLITIRARVQAASGQPVKPWSPVSFVLHTSPDGTEAQTLVSAFSGFNALWQGARTSYQTAIVNADQLFRSQTQTSQEAYDGSLATARRKANTDQRGPVGIPGHSGGSRADAVRGAGGGGDAVCDRSGEFRGGHDLVRLEIIRLARSAA